MVKMRGVIETTGSVMEKTRRAKETTGRVKSVKKSDNILQGDRLRG